MCETILAILQWLLPLLPAVLWCVWWLWCVNWKTLWPVLAAGGWVVVILFVVVSALAWSTIFPTCDCLGFPLPNFWWQLGGTTSLALLGLFCGWLQGRMGWTPPEVTFDPPAEHHDPSHGGHS
jgi:hypothetical protein